MFYEKSSFLWHPLSFPVLFNYSNLSWVNLRSHEFSFNVILQKLLKRVIEYSPTYLHTRKHLIHKYFQNFKGIRARWKHKEKHCAHTPTEEEVLHYEADVKKMQASLKRTLIWRTERLRNFIWNYLNQRVSYIIKNTLWVNIHSLQNKFHYYKNSE